MPTRTIPEDGDIVIRQEKRDGTVVYVLHTAPGPDQYLLPTCDEAAAQALMLAERHGVRAWLTTDESYDFVLLGRVVLRTIQDVLHGLRAEYTEMPGLRLKPEQVQGLCGIEQTKCQRVLDSPVDERFLREVGRRLRTSDGRSSSASREGRVSEPTHVPKGIVSLPERDRLMENGECSG